MKVIPDYLSEGFWRRGISSFPESMPLSIVYPIIANPEISATFNRMDPITFDTYTYRIAGQAFYLLSGEFHYFRVPKADWRRRMQLFKAAGGNCLATYVPWLIHEPQEGHFVFSGEDWLELEAFLQTAQEENLYVIARPGPYQYSELVNHGLPGWLIQNYPEVLALNAYGKPFGYASISYTHPLFLEKVKNWFAAVCPLLARYTVSNGGPIAFTQIDNEMIGIHEWFGSLDYHPASMGIGQPDGKFPCFLQARYGSLTALQQAYHQSPLSFAAVQPGRDDGGNDPAAIRRRKDYFDFYLETIADYSEILVGLLREHGIDTPIVHNSANPGMNAYFQPVIERLGRQFLLGSDHYYTLGQDWAQNNPTPQYAVRSFVSLEMMRLMGFPPTVFEIPGGSCSNWPPVLPSDALTCYLTNLAYGMKGSNYYIFTGGPNPPGVGTTTDLYDYDASIGAQGEIRPLYTAQQTFGALAHQHPALLTGKRLSDVRIAMNLEYARSEHYWKTGGELLVSNVEAWNFLRKGVLSTALCASYSPELIDLDADEWTHDLSSPLVLVSSASLSRAIQQRLVDFVKRGGKLLVTPLLPWLDENLAPCSLLADFLGLPAVSGQPGFSANPRGIAHPRVKQVQNVMGSLYFPRALPEGAQIIGVDEFSQQPFAWQQTLPGGGVVMVVGLQWSQAMREHERMLSSLLSDLGARRVVLCDNPNLWATLVADGDQRVLFVLNLFTAPLTGRFQVMDGDKVLYVAQHTVEPITVKVFSI
jgi:beta-galactosidase